MAKQKTTITVERLRKDVAAYTEVLPTEEQIALAAIGPQWSDLTDDTDWEALYADDQ